MTPRIRRNTTPGRPVVLMVIALCLAIARSAGAVTIYNQTPHTIKATIDGADRWSQKIPAGGAAEAPMAFPSVDKVGDIDSAYEVEVTTVDGPKFCSRVLSHSTDAVLVRTIVGANPIETEYDRNIHVSSISPEGQIFDESFRYEDGIEPDENGAPRGDAGDPRGGTSPSSRNLEFLAIGDPQYFSYKCCNSAGNVNPNSNSCLAPYNHECPTSIALRNVADDTAAQCSSELQSNPNYRGLIIAGDLTQSAAWNDEYQWYLNSWNGTNSGGISVLSKVFDGLGNHDYGLGDYQIRNEIRNRARNTVVYPGPAGVPPLAPQVPHYSWDWHDIHFVQLNLMPANEPMANPPEGASANNPGNALSFLATDLAARVGNSGRPVVLIHHYGFESFSLAWWNENQRELYWQVIAPYNVRVILSGHRHYLPDPDVNHVIHWNNPIDSQSSEFLYNANVAASHLGKYTRLKMGPHNMTSIEVVDESTGSIARTYRILKGDAIHVNAQTIVSGDGSPKYPWKTMQGAAGGLSAMALELNGSSLDDVTWPLETRINAANYSGAVTISTPTKLVALNGTVLIGLP